MAFEANTGAALELFGRGYNCAQAVLAAFGPEYGLSAEDGLRLGAGFGIGMGGNRLTCGAVSGAVAVLGLAYASTGGPGRRLSQGKVNRRVRRFMGEFEARCGSAQCSDLLGNHRGKPGGTGEEGGCTVYVRTAAEILSAILDE